MNGKEFYERRIPMKQYFNPQADFILLGREDIVTTSFGDDHGMNLPSVTDDDWQIGEGDET